MVSYDQSKVTSICVCALVRVHVSAGKMCASLKASMLVRVHDHHIVQSTDGDS